MKRLGQRCAGALAVMLVMLMGGATMLPAQMARQTTREVSGVVTDEHREPLKGAVVQVHDEGTNAVQTYLTDREGHYEFKRLDAGSNYKIWAKYRNGESKKHYLSKFDNGAEKKLDLSVPLP